MTVRILIGDVRTRLAELPDESVNCVVTSPPYYWLRDYGCEGQIGMEDTPAQFVAALVDVFREVRRVLSKDGTVWVNLGDSYYSGNGQPHGSDPKSPSRDFSRRHFRALDKPGMGIPKKSALGIPWRVALAMQADGWTLRSEIIWCRDSAFMESGVKDRPYRQHETVFLFSRSRQYWFDRSALLEESVWHIAPERGVGGHSAAFPCELVRRCIIAGCPAGGTVFDPFGGSGTTALVAGRFGRDAVLIELNPAYAEMARKRIEGDAPMFAKIEVAV